jgi:capsular polysaccharide transport system permease protein
MIANKVVPFKPELLVKSPVVIQKSRWKLTLGVLLALMPTLIGGIYFMIIASNQYVTEMRFAVRSNDTQTLDPLGAMIGMPGNNTLASDSYIVVNYMQSREAVDRLQERLNLRNIFSNPSIDWVSRFNNQREVEYLTRYFQGQMSAAYEPSSNLIRVQVKGYTPQHSLAIAKGLLDEAESLVNRISQKARMDAVKSADDEVKRAELRLRLVRVATKTLRDRETVADPARQAGAKQDMIAKAQGDLASVNAEISAAKRFMKEESPTLLVLRSRQKAIEEQVKAASDDLAGRGQIETVSKMLSAFEELEAEKQFAEKSYGVALASLERSRAEADRMQRYLAVFVRPSLAEYPLYPKRFEMVLVICLAGLMLWGITVFVVQAIKDHL